MQKKSILIIIGMIIIPPAFGVVDEYTQFECEAFPEVCLSRVIAEMQKQISALEAKTQAQQEKMQAQAQSLDAQQRQISALETKTQEQSLSLDAQQRQISALKSKIQAEGFQDRLKDGGFGPEMVWIPAGRFRMGDLQGGGDSDEKPVHEVSVDRFAMSRYEVTFAEYDKFAEATGRQKPDDRGRGRGNRPVIMVSWRDATAYAKWLSEQTGKKYRLPTEAEWEYAARAGTETKYWWGNSIGSNKANCYGNHCGDRFKYTAPVGSFAPNPFGLYDTAGNVWEWTCSEYSSSYDGSEKLCKQSVSLAVIRGGSWGSEPGGVRVTDRDRYSDVNRDDDVGFRLARP
jgi:formylglycine-generating enzyme required for sulfatase activity